MARTPRTHEEQIKKLEEDVEWLWHSVEALLPEGFVELLQSYRDCGTPEEAMRWHEAVITTVMARAEPEIGSPERVLCPLCRRGPSSPYTAGFQYPDGLLRHLGGEKNAHECVIMRAARVRARDYTLDKRAQEFRRNLTKNSTEWNASPTRRKRNEAK